MGTNSLRTFAQLGIALGLVYGAVELFKPFVLPVATAFFITLLLRPLYRHLKRRVPSTTGRAFLCLLIVILVILIPASLLSVLLVREIGVAVASISRNGFDLTHVNTIINHFSERLGFGDVANINIKNYAITSLQSLAGDSTTILGGVLGVFGDVALILFGLFYILQGSDKSRDYLHKMSPLSRLDTDLLVDRTEEVVGATVRGNLILVLLQGGCFTIACLVFHYPAPLLIGLLYGVASMVPVIGTSVVWAPLALYSLATGHEAIALGTVLWAVAQVAGIDHVIGPKLIGSQSRLNPYLTLLGILGGISNFGLIGFILGPTVMALGVVGLEILGRSWKNE
jgi:predicted PurR-regulated permease PerM